MTLAEELRESSSRVIDARHKSLIFPAKVWLDSITTIKSTIFYNNKTENIMSLAHLDLFVWQLDVTLNNLIIRQLSSWSFRFSHWPFVRYLGHWRPFGSTLWDTYSREVKRKAKLRRTTRRAVSISQVHINHILLWIENIWNTYIQIQEEQTTTTPTHKLISVENIQTGKQIKKRCQTDNKKNCTYKHY